jgi:hypothetical protein
MGERASPLARARSVVGDRGTSGWLIFVVGTLAIVSLWLGPFSKDVHWVNGDQISYQRIIEQMRSGDDYYSATALVLHDHEAVRYFRTPVMFWIWQRTDLYTWPATLIVLIISSVLVGVLSWPLAGLGVELWLVGINHPIGTEQWGYNEVWALPFVLLAMFGIRRERWWLAAFAALAAALVRETAVLFLLGGAFGALWLKRPLIPWVAACSGWAVFMVWHLTRTFAVLEPSSTGPGSAGSLWHALDMFGAWLFPLSAVVVLYALWKAWGTHEWFFAAPGLCVLPLAGLWLYRPYWSYLVLPPAIALLGGCFTHLAARSIEIRSVAHRSND